MAPKKPAKPSPSGTNGSTTAGTKRRVHKSEKCNLVMPVPRVKAMLKVHSYANRVSDKAAVFLSSALEYAATEILEVSLNHALSHKRAETHKGTRIHSKHVNSAIKTDPELSFHFRQATLVRSGVVQRAGPYLMQVQAGQPTPPQVEFAPPARRAVVKPKPAAGSRRRG